MGVQNSSEQFGHLKRSCQGSAFNFPPIRAGVLSGGSDPVRHAIGRRRLERDALDSDQEPIDAISSSGD